VVARLPFAVEPEDTAEGAGPSKKSRTYQGYVYAVYNYKGGVWKTSTAIQLGAILARSNHKVLLVDADSQCNLTSFFFNSEEDEDQDGDAQEVEPLPNPDPIDPNEPSIMRWPLNRNALPALPEELLHGFAPVNLRTALRSVLEPDGAEPSAADLCEAVYEIPGYNGNLLLLPGVYNWGTLEVDLGAIVASGGQDGRPTWHDRTNRYTGAIRWMLNKIMAHLSIDYVLIDCPPANCNVNKFFAMSCDYILPPVFPDYFSMSSVQALLFEVLPGWYQWRGQVVAYQDSPAGSERSGAYHFSHLMRRAPQILPFLVQNLELYNPPRGVAMVTKSKSSWIKGLVALVAGQPRAEPGQPAVLRAPIPAIVRRHFRPNRGVMVVPFMRNLRSMFERSHEYGVPITDLNVDWWNPSVRDRQSHENLINEARQFYQSLAAFLEYIKTH